MDNTENELLKKQIVKLEIENNALKHKIDGLYKCWNYDSQKYTELKELYKTIYKK
jgi:hypothetical protein